VREWYYYMRAPKLCVPLPFLAQGGFAFVGVKVSIDGIMTLVTIA
jgi:hypothetical protein